MKNYEDEMGWTEKKQEESGFVSQIKNRIKAKSLIKISRNTGN